MKVFVRSTLELVSSGSSSLSESYMQTHQQWAIPIVFAVAFAECVAILSWLVPATVFFTTFGAVAGASGLNLVPLALAASLGAGSGFWVSYIAGIYLGPRIHDYWPFRNNPQLLDRGHGSPAAAHSAAAPRRYLRPR